ncbi:ABC transporter substrate-binding protein [Chloroflexota bacterium]
MKKTRIGLILLSLVLVSALLLAGCTSQPATSTVTQTATSTVTATAAPKIEWVTIGLTVPTKGYGTDVGGSMGAGLQVWCDDFNDRGGITIDGVTNFFKCAMYDNNSWEAAATLKAVQKGWQEDGVRIWSTGAWTVATPAVASWCLQQGEPSMVMTWAPCSALTPEYPNTWGINSWPAYIGQLCYWYGLEHPGAKAATMSPNMDLFIDAKAYQMIGCLGSGMEIVSDTDFDLMTTDWHPVMAPIVASNPDIIIMSAGSGASNAYTMQACRELGYTGDFLAVNLVIDAAKNVVPVEYYENGKAISPSPDWVLPGNNPEEQYMYRMREAFVQKYPGIWTGDASITLFQASLFETGVRLANSVEPDKILDALLSTNPVPDPNFGDLYWTGEEVWGRDAVLGVPWPVGVAEGDYVNPIAYSDWAEFYDANVDIFIDVMTDLNIPIYKP